MNTTSGARTSATPADAWRASDFDFELPAALIAQAPPAQRSAGRLLWLDAAGGRHDRCILDLPALLAPGDLLVFNDTRVLPARLRARKPTGGQVEILLERPLEGFEALVQVRGSRSLRAGLALASDGGAIELRERCGAFWRVRLPQPTVAFFEAFGQVPLPPYIERDASGEDRERYQSIWARVPGAVAAPTASLHFDAPLLAALAARGIAHCTLTLHVGAGTFQPLRSEALDAHVMHSEHYELGESVVAAVAAAQRAGRRVIAVGTTVARALESAAQGSGQLVAGAGETALFIRPGYRFRVINGLLTNFHLPRSTLLVLVAAFAGREAVLAGYRHAIAERYRFYSYGDAMLLFAPGGAVP